MERDFCVYILATRRNGTLYTGITSNLSHRIWMHKEGDASAFSRRYGVRTLVWYTRFRTALEAIAFEKRVKRWRRIWKLQLIEQLNPQWRDLYDTINQ